MITDPFAGILALS